MVVQCKPTIRNEVVYVLQKVIQLDGIPYFHLVNDQETRVFDASIYMNFGLQTGDTVIAFTKKENCAGDPIMVLCHPRYQLHKVYPFKVYGIKTETIGDYMINYLELGDDLGLRQKLRINTNDIQADQKLIMCKVMGYVPGGLLLCMV